MPGLTGLEVARQASGRFHIGFVTAYDQHTLAAFEQGAADYVLKPASAARLATTVARLKERIGRPAPAIEGLLRELGAPQRGFLRWINASQGQTVHIITVEDICYFQADSKYTRVVTAEGESLIRKPIKELSQELDPASFWQIHRSTIVNVHAIAGVVRDLRGHTQVRLKRREELLAVSAGAGVSALVRYAIGATPSGEGAAYMLLVFTSWLGSGAILVAGYVFYLRAQAAEEEARGAQLRRSALETQQLATRLRLLQAQVEPHFLFNTLSNAARSSSRRRPAAGRSRSAWRITARDSPPPRARASGSPISARASRRSTASAPPCGSRLMRRAASPPSSRCLSHEALRRIRQAPRAHRAGLLLRGRARASQLRLAREGRAARWNHRHLDRTVLPERPDRARLCRRVRQPAGRCRRHREAPHRSNAR